MAIYPQLLESMKGKTVHQVIFLQWLSNFSRADWLIFIITNITKGKNCTWCEINFQLWNCQRCDQWDFIRKREKLMKMFASFWIKFTSMTEDTLNQGLPRNNSSLVVREGLEHVPWPSDFKSDALTTRPGCFHVMNQWMNESINQSTNPPNN